LVDALEVRLRDSGREVSVIAARLDEVPPLPRVELQFQSTAAGDLQMRGAGQLVGVLGLPGAVSGSGMVLGGRAGVVVDVYAVPASGPPTFTGRVSGTTFGTSVTLRVPNRQGKASPAACCAEVVTTVTAISS